MTLHFTQFIVKHRLIRGSLFPILCLQTMTYQIWSGNTEYLCEWKSLAFINISENKFRQKDANVVFTVFHSLSCIDLVVFSWLQLLGCIYLVAFTWLHSFGCINMLHSIGRVYMVVLNWLHTIGYISLVTLHSLGYLSHCFVCFCYTS